MPNYLKSADRTPVPVDPEIVNVVSEILLDVERRGATAVRDYSERFDKWSPARFTLTAEEIDRAVAAVPRDLRDYIDRAAEQVGTFAKAQRGSLSEVEIEPIPGVVLGHRLVPITSVGAYSPAGRYPLIASSLMTTVVPKVAGVDRVITCAPPISPEGIAPAMIYAMASGGADQILCIGGAHGLAALAFGIEDIEPVDMIVGAGNVYVAEAKRQLFGTVGIDLLAGPTEILVIADETANPELIASDLAGQLEHGPTSAGWLISTSAEIAEQAQKAIERRISELPTGKVAAEAWDRYGEIAVCDSIDEAVELADKLASEHVEIHTADPSVYLDRLRNYGSIFLGENTTVPYGDKGIGTNHVLPTARAARYTGGLWVGSFLKALTYQSATDEGSRSTAPMIVAISEAEQLPGHARSAQDRLDHISLPS
ncbi:MAG TPA: histidinol dehydrogenase [Solirubrobacterales bacterium]|jgi:sulfopropanediol 3-dehydrogenase|nr:histidinol dehydrogenase [Solirubrobacterales bacterium]